MKGKQVEQLIEFTEHFITNIDEISILGFQMGDQGSLEVGNTLFDELDDTALAHVLELDGAGDPAELWPGSVRTHIDLHIFINRCIEGVHDGVGCLVSGAGVGLPVIQLDLVAQNQKKIYVGGAHSML